MITKLRSLTTRPLAAINRESRRATGYGVILTSLVASADLLGSDPGYLLQDYKVESPAPAPETQLDPARPNIVFILTDDQGWGDLAVSGHPYLKTPHLDRLAREGIRFTQAYADGSVCSPSRVAAMTGHSPARHSAHYIYSGKEVNQRHGVPDFLNPEVTTVADVLSNAGYATGFVGKWHLGGRFPTPWPTEYGFKSAWPGDSRHRNFWWPRGEAIKDYNHWFNNSDELFVNASIKFIEEHTDGQPFMLFHWPHMPHAPLNSTPEELAVYADVKVSPDDFDSWMRDYARKAPDFENQLRNYMAKVTSMDRELGRLLGYLEKKGLAKNTVVVFMSDQGPEDYTIGNSRNAGLGSPGVLRGRKRSIYEGGVRVPAIVRWPGQAPAGAVSDAVWTTADLLPTLASIAGAEMPADLAPDGENVSDLWRGAERARAKPIFWEWRFDIPGDPAYKSPQLAVREGGWKLLCNPDGSNLELYFLSEDPEERRNVATEHPEKVALLKEKLMAWKASLPN